MRERKATNNGTGLENKARELTSKDFLESIEGFFRPYPSSSSEILAKKPTSKDTLQAVPSCEEKSFNPTACLASTLEQAYRSGLKLWPIEGSRGELEKRFLQEYVVDERGLSWVNFRLTPEIIEDLVQKADVQALLSKSDEEDQAAIKVLKDAFDSAKRYDNCVYKATIEEIELELKGSEKTSFQKNIKTGFSSHPFTVFRTNSDNFILVQVDPETQEVNVLNIDEWFRQAPEEVKNMLIKYYTHKARANIAFTTAYNLQLHNETENVPPIVQKSALMDDDTRRKRLKEVETYISLLERVLDIFKPHTPWFDWREEMKKPNSFIIGDKKSSYYSLSVLLSHLSQCGGIDYEDQRQRAKQLAALNDILSLNPDRDHIELKGEDLFLLLNPYFRPLDEWKRYIEKAQKMLNFLSSKAQKIAEALEATQPFKRVEQALVTEDDLQGEDFSGMSELLRFFKDRTSVWDKFIWQTRSLIQKAIIQDAFDSFASMHENVDTNGELLNKIRGIIEKEAANSLANVPEQSLESLGYFSSKWNLQDRRFYFKDPRLRDMLGIIALQGGIVEKPEEAKDTFGIKENLNSNILKKLQSLYNLLIADYQRKVEVDSESMNRYDNNNKQLSEMLEKMGLTRESYRNLLDPLASIFNRGRKVESELDQYFDASIIVFPLLYMAEKKLADFAADNTLLEEVFLRYSGVRNEEDKRTVRKVFSEIQEIVRQRKPRQ